MGIFNATATYGHGFKPTGNPDEYFAGFIQEDSPDREQLPKD